MSVSAILMAVITTATIPLGPLYVLVGVDIGWPPISGLVKVNIANKLINLYFNHLSACFLLRLYCFWARSACVIVNNLA